MKFSVLKLLLICTLLVFLSSGCVKIHQIKENTRIESNSTCEDTYSLKEVIVARGTISGKYKISNIVGISDNGNYWLFQNDRFISDGDGVKQNENASLTLWDNREKKVLFNLKGLEYASYIRSVFISSHNGKIILKVTEKL